MESTIVVFTSDHGDLRGEHHRHDKGVPYEGSARIPFVIYYKGRIRPGTVINEALSCVDFQPTILKLMGQAPSGREEGRDASVLFTSGRAPAGWEDIVFLRGTGVEAGWVAGVTDRFKLVYATNDEPWLFDLHADPDEMVNAFSDPAHRETVSGLSRRIAAYGAERRDPRVANEKVQADLKRAMDGHRDDAPIPSVAPRTAPAAGPKSSD